MITFTGGKITNNYKTQGLMCFIIDAAGREFIIDKAPKVRKIWQKDLRNNLTAVEKACHSFLYQAGFEIEEMQFPYMQVKLLFYLTELGKPKVRESLHILFKGNKTIKLSNGFFDIIVKGGVVKEEPKFLTLEVLDNPEAPPRHKILIKTNGGKRK